VSLWLFCLKLTKVSKKPGTSPLQLLETCGLGLGGVRVGGLGYTTALWAPHPRRGQCSCHASPRLGTVPERMPGGQLAWWWGMSAHCGLGKAEGHGAAQRSL